MFFCKRYALFLRTIILDFKSSSNRGNIGIKQDMYYPTELKFA